MTERLSLPELESYLWGAATILRGLVDAGDYKQFIFPLLFYKRLSDVWDEEYAEALAETGDDGYARAMADERFAIPTGAHWTEVRETARDVGRAIQTALRSIESANPDRLDRSSVTRPDQQGAPARCHPQELTGAFLKTSTIAGKCSRRRTW